MQPHNVVIALSDPIQAEHVASELHAHFRSVAVALDCDQLRRLLRKQRADLIVLDLELASLHELRMLCVDFPSSSVICTHRLADEFLWTSVLNAGAADFCESVSVKSILQSAERLPVAARAAA
jgi:AmiR/NasT family two-component response regulator